MMVTETTIFSKYQGPSNPAELKRVQALFHGIEAEENFQIEPASLMKEPTLSERDISDAYFVNYCMLAIGIIGFIICLMFAWSGSLHTVYQVGALATSALFYFLVFEAGNALRAVDDITSEITQMAHS